MTPKLKKFFQSWLINTLSVLVAWYLLKGRIHYQKPLDLAIAALLLGILNTFLKPVLMVLALPLVLVSLGLFLLVINAFLLYFVGFLMRPHFYVDGYWAAFWGALIISIVSLILNSLTGTGNSRFRVVRGRPPGDSKPARTDRSDSGDGPVIDI